MRRELLVVKERLWSHRTMISRVVMGAIVVATLLVAGAFFVLPALVAEPPMPLGIDPYVSGQRQLHATEAMARLAVLGNGLATGRPTSDLRVQHARIQHDLEWALSGAGDGEMATEVLTRVDRLSQQLQEENPRAADTVAEIRQLLRQVRRSD